MKLNLLFASLATATWVADAATKNRHIVQFLGTTEAIGTLQDANELYGTNVTTETAFPEGIELGVDFGCDKLPMRDFETQEIIGEGVDCSWLTGDDQAVASITFFHFADTGSTMVHYIIIGMGAFSEGVGDGPLDVNDPNSPKATLMSAGHPNVANTCVQGTGEFKGIQAMVRLSAAFNMDAALYLNCIYEIDLDQGDEVIDAVQERSSENVTQERRVLQFQGAAERLANGVQDANEIAGLNVNQEDALEAFDLVESFGCHKVPMKDFITGEPEGNGIDCLWAIEGGLVTITYYVFDEGSFALVAPVSLAQFVPGFGDGPVEFGNPNSPQVNIMTGSMAPGKDQNTLVDTSGIFEGYKGNSRLGGGASMGDTIWFDCVFELALTAPDDDDSGASTPQSTMLSAASILAVFIAGFFV